MGLSLTDDISPSKSISLNHVISGIYDFEARGKNPGRLSPEDLDSALHHIYQSLQTLKSREESEALVSASMAETPRALVDWRKSITRHTITCLECGVTLKQLSGHHLRIHRLDARTYRLKYGIPQSRPLAARATTAKRRQIMSEVRPWEKAPAYVKAQEQKAAAARKSRRKRAASRP